MSWLARAWQELKQRRVIRAAVLYLAALWLVVGDVPRAPASSPWPRVTVAGPVAVADLARCAELSEAAFLRQNPTLVGALLPRSGAAVRLPPEKVQGCRSLEPGP